MKRRGFLPTRSIKYKLSPAMFTRVKGEGMDVEQVSFERTGDWESYLGGARSRNNYALLPVTEGIPSQRPMSVDADDRFRPFDKVFVSGVRLRCTVTWAEAQRMRLFVFRNNARRDTPSDAFHRPFGFPSRVEEQSTGKVENRVGPDMEMLFEVMNKEELLGNRHVGLHDGPFQVEQIAEGVYDWEGAGGTGLESSFSQGEGRPVGKVKVKVDGGAEKDLKARSFSKRFKSSTLMRTYSDPGVKPYVASHVVELSIYINLGLLEDFVRPVDSMSVRSNPLEVMIGFDCLGGLGGSDALSGALRDMDYKIIYR